VFASSVSICTLLSQSSLWLKSPLIMMMPGRAAAVHSGMKQARAKQARRSSVTPPRIPAARSKPGSVLAEIRRSEGKDLDKQPHHQRSSSVHCDGCGALFSEDMSACQKCGAPHPSASRSADRFHEKDARIRAPALQLAAAQAAKHERMGDTSSRIGDTSSRLGDTSYRVEKVNSQGCTGCSVM
jgi:hypothetical protein